MELAVLVPVLDRPQNVAPLVESFLAGCPEGSALFFITSWGDVEEIAAIKEWQEGRWEDFPARICAEGVNTWPEKINFGVTQAEVDWFLLGADDIAFTPGWWEATATLRADPSIGVIGTNDQLPDGTGGNPRVQTEDLVIHPLVRASYIREHGTIDEPGKVVHDGYHHWCCDDELLWTAKSRGAYAYCAEAHIPHLHPYWGVGELDDTYRKGEAHADEDLALWRDRAVRLLGLQFS